MSFRNRQYCAVLYEEDKTHIQAIDFILKNYECGVIRHDMDVYEETTYNEDGSVKNIEGDLKKPHYHLVWKFPNARSSSSVAKELGITENYLEPCEKYQKAVEYLIHLNNPEKYLYKVEDVLGPIKKDLITFVNKREKDENKKISLIYDWINEQPKPISVSKLSEFCFKNGLWDVFRRSSSIFFRILDEYNYLSIKGLENNKKYYRTDEDISNVIEQLDIYNN